MSEPQSQLIARGGWAEDRLLNRLKPPYGPRNTVSNLAYILVGTGLAWAYQDSSSAALAVSLWVLGTGSALYHALKDRIANRMDWTGMLMVFGSLAAHGFAPASPAMPWVMLGVSVLAALYYRAQGWISRDWWMVVLGLVASAPVIVRAGWSVPLGLAWLAFAAAYGAWQLDKRGSKLVGLWGHALWHCATAIGIGLVYIAQR